MKFTACTCRTTCPQRGDWITHRAVLPWFSPMTRISTGMLKHVGLIYVHWVFGWSVHVALKGQWAFWSGLIRSRHLALFDVYRR